MERAGPSTTHVDEASCLHDAHNLAEMHYQSTTVARRLSCRPIMQQRWTRVKSPGDDIKTAPASRMGLRRACTLPLNARCINRLARRSTRYVLQYDRRHAEASMHSQLSKPGPRLRAGTALAAIESKGPRSNINTVSHLQQTREQRWKVDCS